MNEMRARFEEIWPVPDLVEWNKVHGMYAPIIYVTTSCDAAREHNARLDTFTRCQETTDVYVSLVQELINELDEIAGWVESGRADGDDVIRATRLTDRAKQIMEQKK